MTTLGRTSIRRKCWCDRVAMRPRRTAPLPTARKMSRQLHLSAAFLPQRLPTMRLSQISFDPAARIFHHLQRTRLNTRKSIRHRPIYPLTFDVFIQDHHIRLRPQYNRHSLFRSKVRQLPTSKLPWEDLRTVPRPEHEAGVRVRQGRAVPSPDCPTYFYEWSRQDHPAAEPYTSILRHTTA